MEINGLKAVINMPVAPEGEGIHGLPPHCRQPTYKVDEYPACPNNWMHGSDIASSYFVQLDPGRHMWFDFNENAHHMKDVAVVLSVQGINPITGQQTKQLRLEQYRTNCPVHNVPFKQDRFCESCNYAWPAQNYMTTASTPAGNFWIDGFRSENGQVRGFLITEETMRGVAAQLIGEERVWAIGIAFYLSKASKPAPVHHGRRSVGAITKKSGPGGSSAKKYTSGHWVDNSQAHNWSPDQIIGASGIYGSTGDMWAASSGHTDTCSGEPMLRSANLGRGIVSVNSLAAAPADAEAHYSAPDLSLDDGPILACPADPTHLEIGAGAKITQQLAHPDHHELSHYQDEPAGLIYLNYCTKDEMQRILKAGKRDTSGSFLAGLRVGN